jgi:hypothetical protein
MKQNPVSIEERRQALIAEASKHYSKEELDLLLGSKEQTPDGKVQEKEIGEKKLSFYSLELCKEIKKALPYLGHSPAGRDLAQALMKYITAYKKLGGHIE